MSKTCPACGNSISVLDHMAQSEGGDFYCPTCGMQLVQELSADGKLLGAGSFITMMAAIMLDASMWLLAVGAAMGLCAWRWGGDYKSTGTINRAETLGEAFSKPMTFAGSFVGFLGIGFVLLALLVGWLIADEKYTTAQGAVVLGAFAVLAAVCFAGAFRLLRGRW